jgi:hypothetical protein
MQHWTLCQQRPLGSSCRHRQLRQCRLRGRSGVTAGTRAVTRECSAALAASALPCLLACEHAGGCTLHAMRIPLSHSLVPSQN